jgi:hypothetical protein
VAFLERLGEPIPEAVVETCWQSHQRRIRVLEAFERGEIDADAVARASFDETDMEHDDVPEETERR